MYISFYNSCLTSGLYMDPKQSNFSSESLRLFTKIQFDILSTPP
jgi:hypothetical protein